MSVHQLKRVNRHQVSRLKRGTVLVNFVGFSNRFLFIYSEVGGRLIAIYLLACYDVNNADDINNADNAEDVNNAKDANKADNAEYLL
jgi:hypothetical protein